MSHSKGFSLVELAVAFTIIVLLLAGAMIPFSTQVDLRAVADTQRSMESIREAMIGFAQANGRLPCPANGTTADGATDIATWGTPIAAGAEQWDPVNNGCFAVLGVVPWSTIGVLATDSWGRRFTYRVSPAFADAIGLNTWQSLTNPPVPLQPPANWPAQTAPAIPSPGNQNPTCPPSAAPAVAPFVLSPLPGLSSFALCSLGDIAVYTRGQLNTTAVTLSAALPAIVISHGKNGYGAWQANGTRRNPLPVGDELRNVNGTATDTPPGGGYTSFAFYSRSPTPPADPATCVDPVPVGAASGASACEFDDIVVTISSNALIARMVTAGRLP